MTLEEYSHSLRNEMWQLLVYRLAFKEKQRAWENGEIPNENFNRTVISAIFESLQQCQINCLCRLDDDKNISFHTAKKKGVEFGFENAEV